MSEAQPMPSVRRRPIPGMASQPITPPPPPDAGAGAGKPISHVDDDARASEAEASTTALAEGNDVAAGPL